MLKLYTSSTIEGEERRAQRTMCDTCSEPASALRPLHPVTGRCPGCEEYARDRWYASRYASEARPGQVVDEDAVATFAYLLPRALMRRGMVLERDALRWVIRSRS